MRSCLLFEIDILGVSSRFGRGLDHVLNLFCFIPSIRFCSVDSEVPSSHALYDAHSCTPVISIHVSYVHISGLRTAVIFLDKIDVLFRLNEVALQ